MNSRGREQAASLREPLSAFRFDAVLTSPAARAIETARQALSHRTIRLCDELWEWDYGDYEGRTAKDIRDSVPGWAPWSHGFPNGEKIEAVARRVRDFAERFVTGQGNVVLVVGHGHWLRLFAAAWLGWASCSARCLALETAGFCVLGSEYESRAIRGWNLTAR